MDTVIKRGEIIPYEQRKLVSQRYRRITRAVNAEFWGIDSETAHSFYVGSYGRGTAIDTSDIDMLVELPKDVYNKHDALKGNGQSRLLQAVKTAILATYPRTDIHGDGQVVVVNFSDGMKFEVLPAFQHQSFWGDWDGTYEYPDSNMGGNWMTTNPKAEQKAMKEKNDESNGLLFDTCRHMRQIRDNHFKSFHLPGIVIDSFAYHYIGGWHWTRENEEKSNDPSGTYEKKLYNSSQQFFFSLTAPGSGKTVETADYLEALKKVLNYMSKD